MLSWRLVHHGRACQFFFVPRGAPPPCALFLKTANLFCSKMKLLFASCSRVNPICCYPGTDKKTLSDKSAGKVRQRKFAFPFCSCGTLLRASAVRAAARAVPKVRDPSHSLESEQLPVQLLRMRLAGCERSSRRASLGVLTIPRCFPIMTGMSRPCQRHPREPVTLKDDSQDAYFSCQTQ